MGDLAGLGETGKMGVNGPKKIIMDKSHPKTMPLRGWVNKNLT